MFAASQFSNARVREDREERPVHVHHLAVRVAATNDVVRIPPALLALDTRRAPEWAERRDCRLRECPPNRQDVRVHLLAGRDNVISMGPKKGR